MSMLLPLSSNLLLLNLLVGLVRCLLGLSSSLILELLGFTSGLTHSLVGGLSELLSFSLDLASGWGVLGWIVRFMFGDWEQRGNVPTVSLAAAAVSCPDSIPAASFSPTFLLTYFMSSCSMENRVR